MRQSSAPKYWIFVQQMGKKAHEEVTIESTYLPSRMRAVKVDSHVVMGMTKKSTTFSCSFTSRKA